MHDPLDIFLSARLGDRKITAKEREAFREAYRSDDSFCKGVSGWLKAERRLSDDFERALPDRELIVLDVMFRRGMSLSDTELQRLADAAGRLETAASEVTAFEQIRDRVGEDLLAFESCWENEARNPLTSKPQDRGPLPARRTSAARWMWRVPVAAVVVFFVAIVVLLGRRDSAFEHVATGQDETRLIEFADGSAVHLRENSTFSYVPSDRQGLLNRRARLDGRAFFEIAPRQQGLVVSTPTAAVTVIGTVFALAAGNDATDLYLVDGRVSFAPEGAPREAVTVGAGQHSRVALGDRPTTPVEVDLADALEWTGFFVFRSTPLEEIAQRLGRHFDVEIHLAEDLAGEQVTGTFDARRSVDAILETVAAAVGSDLERRGQSEFALR